VNKRDRERTLQNVARLKRVERTNPSPEIAAVREDLESQLGGTVPRSTAARLLGVSHTALNNWIASGDVPVVVSRRGRKEVPISFLVELQQQVAEQRSSSPRKLHALEPIMAEARRRAERMRPLPSAVGSAEPHRTSELRGLAYHRALAPRLRRSMVDEAQRKLRRWQEEGKVDPRRAKIWEEVFALPMPAIREAITADDERGRDLRQSSPLAGLLSEPERRKALQLS
jgi:hypothetical protein